MSLHLLIQDLVVFTVQLGEPSVIRCTSSAIKSSIWWPGLNVSEIGSSEEICYLSQTSQLRSCVWNSSPSSRWAVWLIGPLLLNAPTESPSCSRGIHVCREHVSIFFFLFEKTTVWLKAKRPWGKGRSLGNPGLMQQKAQRRTVASGWGWKWLTSVVLSWFFFFLSLKDIKFPFEYNFPFRGNNFLTSLISVTAKLLFFIAVFW